jgi:hypothetical protein
MQSDLGSGDKAEAHNGSSLAENTTAITTNPAQSVKNERKPHDNIEEPQAKRAKLDDETTSTNSPTTNGARPRVRAEAPIKAE